MKAKVRCEKRDEIVKQKIVKIYKIVTTNKEKIFKTTLICLVV